MSASREKKVRQELSSQEGYVDLKAQREAEEKASNRKANALYITIAVLFVAVAAVLLVLKSGILQKNAVAATIDDTDYTPAQVDFYYYNTYSNLMSYYGNVIGLTNTTDLDENVSAAGLVLFGLEEGTEMTWDAFLKEQALKALSETQALYGAALAAGHTADEEIAAHVQENVDAINIYAAQSGYSAKEYLTLVYGTNMNMDTFKQMLEMSIVADHYRSEYVAENMIYTDDDLEAYYAENKAAYDMGSYEYLYFSDEAAAANAEAAIARLEGGEKLSDIAKDYETGTYYHIDGSAKNYGTSPMDQWVFDEARVAGEFGTVKDDNGGYYVMVFEDVSRPEYPLVNARHILINADTSALDKESDTYETESKSIWDEAKADAEAILEQWKSGEATADSFAELAATKSGDTGSAANGGLYEDINKTTNFVSSFKDWCLDASRQVGDTGIVESTYGYHVMYLDSFGDIYWKSLVTSDMRTADESAWIESLVEPLTVTEQSGMKYVG